MAVPKLRVNKTFLFTSRKMFVIAGDIISGEVCSGMYLIADELGSRFQIHFVEMLKYLDGKEGVALTFTYKDESELEQLTHIAHMQSRLIIKR